MTETDTVLRSHALELAIRSASSALTPDGDKRSMNTRELVARAKAFEKYLSGPAAKDAEEMSE